MACWSDIQAQAQEQENAPAYLLGRCHAFLKEIATATNRNVIAYYSGWLKNNVQEASIVETDKNAFMNAVYQMDRSKGLDLILHTPGGDIAVTESIVGYLKSLFGNDIRAFIPQIAMSAGTMLAMSCKEIIMGKQSALGPIDPQIEGVACQMVIDEFRRAVKEVSENPQSLGLWQAIISKYGPTYLTVCEDAIKWSEELAEKWLVSINPNIDMRKVKNVFINHDHSYSHSRHISKEICREAGLNVRDMEQEQKLQDLVLGFHHCCMVLFDYAPVIKFVTSQNGHPYLQVTHQR